MNRPRIAIVGAGRAGTALGTALHDAGYRVTAVHSLSPTSAARLADRTGAAVTDTAVAAVLRSDITILTVPDGAIAHLGAILAATGVALRDHALVHCSGAQTREALAAARQQGAAVGACHPLQAISREAEPGVLRGTYFGIDADQRIKPALELLVADIGGVAFAAPAGDRALYHAAAVLAGNAPLALLDRAAQMLVSAGVDPAIAGQALAGLLEGAARNARRLGVAAALTGPVVRDDAGTVARHLEALRGDPPAQRLYHRLARETLRAAGSTGRPQVSELLAGATPSRGATAAGVPARASRRAPSRLAAG